MVFLRARVCDECVLLNVLEMFRTFSVATAIYNTQHIYIFDCNNLPIHEL